MLLLQGGTLHLPDGTTRPETDLLSDGSTICAIGRDLSADGATILDVAGKEVYPGFLVPATAAGITDYGFTRQLDSSEHSDPIYPALHVKYALDSREVALQQFYRSGITAFGASPAVSNILGGQMGVYHITGRTRVDMCIADTVALKGNFISDVKAAFTNQSKPPMTRMGMAALLRDAFRRAQDYGTGERTPYSENNEVLLRVLSGALPLLMNVNTTSEISTVLEIAGEFGVRLVLHNCFQGHLMAEEIRASGASILLGDLMGSGLAVAYGTDCRALLELYRSGVPMGLSNSGDSGMGGRENLLWSAARLAQAGATPAELSKMVTIETARILGVDDKIGSLEVGKLADIGVWSGDPFSSYAADVDTCIISGKVIYTKEAGLCC